MAVEHGTVEKAAVKGGSDAADLCNSSLLYQGPSQAAVARAGPPIDMRRCQH